MGITHAGLDIAEFDALYRGQKFRKPKGKQVFVAEKMTVDRTYEAHYNFVNIYVMLRNEKTGKTENVRWEEFKNNWVRVDPPEDLEDKRDAAIDSALGSALRIPWYRS